MLSVGTPCCIVLCTTCAGGDRLAFLRLTWRASLPPNGQLPITPQIVGSYGYEEEYEAVSTARTMLAHAIPGDPASTGGLGTRALR
jgi:hypothetical protein